ncbi:calmodulin-like protein 4 [Lycorma delicatula]|uniref:calmodulin-like protein 4 n=1 Tax=Lycorma delicatula TaxID=130591 RepID=UPI003F50DC79
MAHHFREQDIDEFRECFFLFARNGQIRTLDELNVIMRSLGISPTITELKMYLKGKGGKMSFPDFLQVIHTHTRAEDLLKEVVEASQAADREKKGVIPASQLRQMLLKWGEQPSPKEASPLSPVDLVRVMHNERMTSGVFVRRPPLQHAYWWNDDIARLRKEALAARRSYQRATKKGLPDLARQRYVEARGAYNAAIKAAKTRCWKDLSEVVDNDP